MAQTMNIFAAVILILCLLYSQLASSPPDSPGCSKEKGYIKCVKLPTLNSTIQYTHNPTNSSLSVLFISAPETPEGWIGWGINPTGSGMVGAQVVAAFKRDKNVVVKTFRLESQTDVTEGKLSFDVWNIRGEDVDDVIKIYATVKIPDNVESVNHTWQVGSSVEENGMIVMHSRLQPNLDSKGRLSLVGASVRCAKSVNFHERINIVAWGILQPIGVIAIRNVKYCPALFYVHIACHIIAFFIGVGGGIIGILIGIKSNEFKFTNHGIAGIILMVLALIQTIGFYSLRNREHTYEAGSFLKIYHYISGYLILLIGMGNIFLGYEMYPDATWAYAYYGWMIGLFVITGSWEAYKHFKN